MKQRIINNVEAFEMWCYRKLLKISWTDKVKNEEVLRRIGKECEIIKNVKNKKLRVSRPRNEMLLRLIMQGKIKGTRSVGGRKTSWLSTSNLRKWYGCS